MPILQSNMQFSNQRYVFCFNKNKWQTWRLTWWSSTKCCLLLKNWNNWYQITFEYLITRYWRNTSKKSSDNKSRDKKIKAGASCTYWRSSNNKGQWWKKHKTTLFHLEVLCEKSLIWSKTRKRKILHHSRLWENLRKCKSGLCQRRKVKIQRLDGENPINRHSKWW